MSSKGGSDQRGVDMESHEPTLGGDTGLGKFVVPISQQLGTFVVAQIQSLRFVLGLESILEQLDDIITIAPFTGQQHGIGKFFKFLLHDGF